MSNSDKPYQCSSYQRWDSTFDPTQPNVGIWPFPTLDPTLDFDVSACHVDEWMGDAGCVMRDSCRLQLSEHEAIIRHGHSLSDSNQGTGADCRYRPNCCPESLSLSNSYWTEPLANRFKPGTSSCIGNQTELVQGISNNSQSILCKPVSEQFKPENSSCISIQQS